MKVMILLIVFFQLILADKPANGFEICKNDPNKCYEHCAKNPVACAQELSGPFQATIGDAYVKYLKQKAYDSAIAAGKSKRSAAAIAGWAGRNAKAYADMICKFPILTFYDIFEMWQETGSVQQALSIAMCANGIAAGTTFALTGFLGPTVGSGAGFFARNLGKPFCGKMYNSIF
ncbi:hypothetical protein HK099_006423 [Clydaea vesicula]|uniref:Uncharacterized protein n=1 Tax=Clydaea vesicula TaxID=447962 RepID=A0AAD5TY87_9FUNG|nr:hypothetical protein HK099_006423 [Clydaea vesicula]